MSSLWVQKFGGTSVGSPERIRAIAKKIAHDHSQGVSLIVVVSAMGHMTDDLLSLAHQVSPHPQAREVDMLLTAGERISMALLSMALSDLGLYAVSFTGSQVGIITSSHHRRARIIKILGDRVRQALQENSIVIVAGFQGVSEKKEVTTLGRGGSDTTAVALAAHFQAEKCEIYTDVDGVFSADPHLAQSKVIPQIDYSVMMEFAQKGCGVLHSRSVELAHQYGVPLWVKNSLQESEGTQMVVREMEETQVVGVTHDEDKRFVEIELMRPSVIGAVIDCATEHQVPFYSLRFFEGKLQFFILEETQEIWQKICQKLSVDGFVRSFEIGDRWVPVSLVGHRLIQDGEILSRALSILDQNSISVTIGEANSLTISFFVSKKHARDAVALLHGELCV